MQMDRYLVCFKWVIQSPSICNQGQWQLLENTTSLRKICSKEMLAHYQMMQTVSFLMSSSQKVQEAAITECTRTPTGLTVMQHKDTWALTYRI